MELTKLPRAVTEVVRVALDDAEITHREVTRRTGIPTATLSRRMTGNSPFDMNELALIAGILGVWPSELIRKAEELIAKSSAA
jgi:transcriptional regulator with XRE-family HTH domain